jgi:hypothetical protein
MVATTVHAKAEPHRTIDLKKYRTSIHSILEYLTQLGYIDSGKLGYVHVLHPGWNATQTAIGNFMQFLSESIIVPIVVSAVTALITLWISSALGT